MRIRESGRLRIPPIGAGGVHPYHELLYLASGIAELQWMDRRYRMAAPCMALIPAHTPHWLTPDGDVSGWYLEVDMQSVSFPDYDVVLSWNQRQSREGGDRSPPAVSSCIDGVTSVVDAYEIGELDGELAHRLLELDIRKLLLLVERYAPEPGSAAPPRTDGPAAPAVERQLYIALRHIERSYAKNVTVEELANLCHLTPSYVIRLFKQTFGATPIQYLQELRLKAAVSYLSTTDIPVQEIARMTGFSNLHYFSRIFKQKIGVSPTAWRNNRKRQRGTPSA
ncbi:AraC family transcriptional regulator [Paenibacillus sp.]|uniref:helix-turn-helix transcriptional regulator n=1 Tax=Paenibacillus sp. TaxID=58172 RepID=UPI002D487D5F|nr:AraC family transcriptional regulator [Paenibacillus sp.]HZG85778.1 AraC family transcriptional regulator [Paenibacillus sp.]